MALALALGARGLGRTWPNPAVGAVIVRNDGAGPVIVLVHGSPGTSKAWQRVAERLAGRFRVVAPSLPGYGESTPAPPGGPADNTYAAEAIEAIADAVGPLAALVGHSYGGVVALRVALRAKVAPPALGLFEPVAVPILGTVGDREGLEAAKAVFDGYCASAEAGDPRAVRTMVEYWFGPGAFEQMPEPMRAYLVENTANNVRDVRATFRDAYPLDGLRALAMPVLVVHGERSPEAMRKICEALASTVRRGSLVRLDNATHALTTTHADAVAGLIAKLADPREAP